MKRLFTIVCIFSALTATAQIDSYQGIGSFLFLGDKVGAAETDTTNNVFETRRLLVNDTTNFPDRRTLVEWGPTLTQIAAFNSDNQCFNSGTGAFEWTGVDSGERISFNAEDNLLTFEVKGAGGSNSIEMQDGVTTLTDIMRYGSDLSGSYTARSLVDKGYVDALISVAGSDGQIIYNNAGAYAGTSGLFWDDTNSRLGIGTTAPQKSLHVVSSSTTTGISVGKNDGLNLMILGFDNSLNYGSISSFANGNPSTLSLNGGGGNVGIGQGSPASRLSNSSSIFGDGTSNAATTAITWTISGASNYATALRNTSTSGHGLFTGTAGSTSSQIAFRASRNTSTATFTVLGNGQIDTEGLRLFFNTATQETNYILANSSGSNVNVGLIPKGSGAIVADIPDATATGGNARGLFAVDLQINRLAATEVASGTESAILGGQQNTASGNTAAIIGGFQSTASGAYCFVQGYQNTASTDYTFATGANALAADYGQEAHASGSISATGDAQVSRMVLRKAITGAGAQELYANGTNKRCRVPSGRAFNATVQLVATCDVVGNGSGIAVGETYIGTYEVGIKNNGGESALVGTVQNLHTAQSDTGMSTASVSIIADNTNDALSINFTPPSTAGTTTVINVVATVHWTQVGF